jgi:o-succinylbenzoate synthase
MNKIELIYSPYKLQLKKTFFTAKDKIKVRKGFIIKLQSSSGRFGIGDAAPLPQFGSESYDEALNVLRNIKLNFKIDIENIYESIDNVLSRFSKLPALRSGIEQALLNLICSDHNISLNQLLERNSKKIINVNAVIGLLSPAESANRALLLQDSGFSTLKVKLGRDSFQKDLECIEAIIKGLNDKIKIRIDINGKWNLSNAKRNLKLLEQFNIEFAEQPVNRIDSFLELSKATLIPLAADESIRSIKDAKLFLDNNAAKVLVLKPMMLGGIIPTLKIIDMAKLQNVKVVISSSFESSIGRSMAIFAASLVQEDLAHGLATAEYFKNDLTKNPYPVKHGKIYL